MPLTQLAPPYPIFTDKSGLPLDNGYLYFGTANLNPETNPIAVYYDAALTQPAAQPLRTSNGYVMRNGSPAIIYANDYFSVTVRDKKKSLVIYSPSGYGITPGTSASTTAQLTYNEGSDGAVNRVLTSRLQDYVSVQDFGAVGNGVADDTAAFNAAIAYLNTVSGSAMLNVSGSFVINGSLTAITQPDKTINAYGATIFHNGGTLFTFSGGSASRGTVLGLRYICPFAPTAGTCAFEINGANQTTIRDITGVVNILLKAGLSAFVGGYTLDNIQMSTINGTQTVIDHGTGANAGMNRVVLTAIGINRVLDQTTPTNATATGIKFSNAWDTGIFSGLLLNGFLYGLDANRTAANTNISNFRLSDCYFDYCANGMRLKNTAAGGGINNWYIVNGWFVGMDGYSIDIDTGLFSNIKFVNVQALTAGKNNWRINVETVFSDITLENCVGQFANRYNATNTGTDQDDFVALSGGFRVFNSRFGQSANNFITTGVPNWQGRYGMNIALVSAKKYFVQGNQMEGSTADCNFSITNNVLPVGNEFSGYISNNMVYGGATAPAYAITDTPAVPTSAVTQTYRNPFCVLLYIYGGTVTDVKHNGVTVSATTNVSLDLSPGDTWAVTYSVAPTIRRVFKA